jgi:GPH family glycoside/pentoside/hexuronide:cation symporter
MVALSTRNGGQRGLLATLSNASMVAAAGVGASILVPILLQPIMFVTGADGTIDRAASYNNWRMLGIALAVLTFLGIMLEYFFTRERITEETMNLNVKEEKIPMRKHIEVCTKEKFWWMVVIYILFFQMGQLVKNTSMSFYARWMFDSVLSSSNPEATSGALMSTLGLVGGLPSAVGMVIAWPLASKLGKKRAVVLGLILSLIGGIVAFINVHSFPIVTFGVVLKAVGIIPSQYVMVAILSDVLDHLEAKNGFRSDGFTMSIYGSIMVGLLGLAVGIVSGLLGATGYDATLTRQPAAAENVLIFVYLGMDMVSFIASIILLWRMDVEKHAAEDQEKIKQNHEKAASAGRK